MLLHSEQDRYADSRYKYLVEDRPELYSVLVQDLPQHLQSGPALQEHFEQMYGGTFHESRGSIGHSAEDVLTQNVLSEMPRVTFAVTVATNCAELTGLQSRAEKIRDELERAISRDGGAGRVGKSCCRCLGGKPFGAKTAELNRLNRNIVQLQQQILDDVSRPAISQYESALLLHPISPLAGRPGTSESGAAKTELRETCKLGYRIDGVAWNSATRRDLSW